MTVIDFAAAADRYRRMRSDGKLAHLSERVYRDNLQSIGLLWNGPQPEPSRMPVEKSEPPTEAP